jgi:hypothetical protein
MSVGAYLLIQKFLYRPPLNLRAWLRGQSNIEVWWEARDQGQAGEGG